ncbi:MAG: rod shape-determining protein MreC [Bacteroidales bacterium]|nr:rod shape-determining protein MreC [Bacteroidales bacterium]
MRQLFNLILKQHFFILFLALEVLSFSFIFSSGFHRSKFFGSTNFISAAVKNSSNRITSYFNLKKANKSLVIDNAFLREKLLLGISDSTYYEPEFFDTNYRVIPAKVISNSISKRKNYILLNRGKKHGIEPDMGVVASDGIVGIVVKVSENYCNVMSLLHIDNMINARIRKNNHLANMRWKGQNYRIGFLEDIPGHIYLQKGDTIVTSGNSYIFPGDLMIGTIDIYEDRQDLNFNTATVKYSVDFNKLFYVYIIANEKRDEQVDTGNMKIDE